MLHPAFVTTVRRFSMLLGDGGIKEERFFVIGRHYMS